ncbi:hypothetical protein D3C72_1761540 [compost metagenome]
MLQAGRQQAIGLDDLLLAVAVEVLDGDLRRTLHFGVIVRNGEAAFLIDRELIGRSDDLRVDEDARGLLVPFLGDVEHQHALRHADLDGGEPDARGVVHGLEHIVGKATDVGIDGFDRGRDLTQDRIGEDDKRLDRHIAPITDLSVRVQENWRTLSGRPGNVAPR